MITIRKAVPGDVGAIMRCYEAARSYMRANGNISQWTGGYPSRELVESDIAAGNMYVGCDSEGSVTVVFAFIIGEDPTYRIIEDGSWPNDLPYGTIHRLGSDGRYGGMLRLCVEFCLKRIGNLRLDTHPVNATMLRGVASLGFRRCGIIYCCDGTPRIAFHLTTTD